MGKAGFSRRFRGIFVLVAALLASVTTSGKVIYVDTDATGANDGTSWENAYFYLQDALMFAVGGDEIRVAQGVYKPDDFVLSDRPSRGREETFQLVNGVTLKGGYAGAGTPDPNSRNIDLYKTILSGDLNGNDVEISNPEDLLNELTRAENSYHVITTGETNDTPTLDGLIVSAGNANDAQSAAYGAGMDSYGGYPTMINCVFKANSALYGGGAVSCIGESMLTNCSFIGNWAQFGGAIYWPRKATLSNCTFSGNSASGSGGAIYNPGSGMDLFGCIFTANYAKNGGGMSNLNVITFPTTLTNCTFTGNWAHADEGGGGGGGGMHNHGSSPTLVRCTFTRNSAEGSCSFGGAIANIFQSSPILTNCTFSENSAPGGGAIWSGYDSAPTITGCTFRGNSADVGGVISNFENGNPKFNDCTLINNFARWSAGMDNVRSNPTLDNCIFIANISSGGGCGGIDTYFGSPTITNCTFFENSGSYDCGGIYCYESPGTTITNCILWGSSDSQLIGPAIVTYTDIKGGYAGIGNINTDPCFAEPGYWDPNGTAEDPNDDFWVSGDYHLKSQAGRWEPNEGRWVMDEVTSPCIDAGDPMSPIGYEPFPNGGIVNMGAYGGTEEASKSYFGGLVCERIVAGDVNGDCLIDFKDFFFVALHWLESH